MPTTSQNKVSRQNSGPINESQSGSNQLDPVWHPRPVISTLDTWDDATRIEYPYSMPSIGKRPLFNVPSVAVTSESINTIQSSFNKTGTQGASIATWAAMVPNPHTSSTVFKVVPSMAQNLFVDSNVQVSFFVMLATAAIPDTITLQIFRDGQPISQFFYVTTAAQGVGHSRQELGSGTYVDTGAARRKYHVYDLRWKVGGGPAGTGSTAYAFNKNRTFQASNLRAQ